MVGCWARQVVKATYRSKSSKKDVSILVGKLWSDTNPEILKTGLKKDGIVPYNRNVILKEEYEAMACLCWQKSLSNPTSMPNSDSLTSHEVATSSRPRSCHESSCIYSRPITWRSIWKWSYMYSYKLILLNQHQSSVCLQNVALLLRLTLKVCYCVK